jgi:protein O-GlcNAc transferase
VSHGLASLVRGDVMSGPPVAWTEAVGHYQAGRLAEAEAACRLVLARVPDQPDALGLLAVAVQQQGRAAEAETLFARLTVLQPQQARAWNNLANNQAEQGKREAAVESYRRALALQPDYPVALKNLGQTLRELGRLPEALDCYRRAVALQPGYAEAQLGLGVTLSGLGQAAEAVAALRQAIAAKPDYAEAYSNLGNALRATGVLDEAIAAYERAIALRPDFAEAHSNLGFALRDKKRLRQALAHCRTAIDLRHDYAEGYVNLGLVLQDLGDVDGAVAALRRALTIDDSFVVAHSNLIFALDLLLGVGFGEQQGERRRWGEKHAARFAPVDADYSNTADPERRLRVGYVSADFKQHSAAYCFGPVLRHHGHERFTVACYSGVTAEDELTREFRTLTDIWRPTAGMSDNALAEQICQDKIDILVDLSGHSAGNRLLVFARKPAPVQVTAWGHANGTGLPTIDYLFSDPLHVPGPMRSLFAETIYDLPCLITYEAPAEAPSVAPLPALERGAVTFGCFNRLAKVTEPALALWAHILRAVPGSRLMLKDGALSDEAARAYVTQTLARHGIAEERIVLKGGTSHREHLEAYSEVDIALDPFPQNGGISTYDALWMGVPVVAMTGDSGSSRVAGSILNAVGLVDWLAADAAGYARLAVERSRNVEALARLRGRLRDQVSNSVAGNPVLYTRAVEDAYRTIWRRWCQARLER